MSKSMLVHDYNNLEAVRDGYLYCKEPKNANHCEEVMRMIETGSIKTKSQVEIERKKRGIERR